MAALLSVKRTVFDWGHWDDAYEFAAGRNPDFVSLEVATTSLFDGEARMVIFNPGGKTLLTYSRGTRRGVQQELIRCARDQLPALVTLNSFRRLACPSDDGELYVGVITPLTDSASLRPARGALVLFEPLLKSDYGPNLSGRLSQLGEAVRFMAPGDAVAAARAGVELVDPPIHSNDRQRLGLRRQPVLPIVARSLADDLLLILAMVAGLLVFRILLVLERRRQKVQQRKVERRAAQRIRRACRDLDALLEGMGMGPEGLPHGPSETLVLARLIHNETETAPDNDPLLFPENEAASMESRLAEVANRFQHFLRSACSLALFDSLTQLPNRRYFIEQLQVESQRAHRSRQASAILFVDIDKFKNINDTYGHDAGDAALVITAQRLRDQIRSGDFLARYGGDEFAILMAPFAGGDLRSQARQLAQRVAKAFEASCLVAGVPIEISLSIGVTTVEPDESDIEACIKRSDIAMYQAKQLKHSRISIFETDAATTQLDDYRLYSDLMRALRQGELCMLFQPIVDGSDTIHGVEALARWHHPQEGDVSPEVFIALAERYRQMDILGVELLRLAIEGFVRLRQQLGPELQLSVNVTPSQLTHPTVVHRLLGLLAREGIPPHRLTVEITERSVLESTDTVTGNIRLLQDQGVRLTLDDFGTGFSSLNLLNTLKPNGLKIDKSFVMAMHVNPFANQIVTLIAGLGSRMELNLVAEGVDNPDTLVLLQNLGLRFFQGFHFCSPLSVEGVLARYSSGSGSPAALSGGPPSGPTGAGATG
ncbi:bifunctional diguanylate cyclase/phosphodiesterase [Synechococcus sp. BA-132 BA5]|uniref:bifunctional diguanylate cyclase/phosphodiesterase n=1 Tax=Synechococcus sp. BA-132 BA5 TaxID=3110252 RepID=UPI002B206F18|nr:bifunctional diguanylate cyclase/phosphodiesterase [Synechococcus sp. BA-132 BA5]MEA5414884.1 bifunctional diguanylate cyclase/phosphodiesterase [Synechococcus sp. BA-132 BA5]